MKKLFCFFFGHSPKFGKKDKALNYVPGENTIEGALDYCERCKVVFMRKLTNNEFEAVIRASIVQEEVKKIQKQYEDNTVEFLQKHKNKIN